MSIFNKYKSICNEEYVVGVKSLTECGCILLVGPKYVGKYTIIKEALKYEHLVVLDDVSADDIATMYNSLHDKSYVCIRNVDQIRVPVAKMLCSLIDSYITRVCFVLTARTHTYLNEIRSRASVILVRPPKNPESVVDYVCSQESLALGTVPVIPKGSTIHDILIYIDFAMFNIEPALLYEWKLSASRIATNLKKSKYIDIRKAIYKLYGNAVDCRDLLKHFAYVLIQCSAIDNTKCDIAHLAAKFDHTMTIGNKNIYHIEAFLFNAKNIL